MTNAVSRTTLRVVAAALVLAGGVIHYRLWNERYRHLPGQIPGVWVVKTGFPINAAASAVLALALIAVGFGAMSRWRLPVVLAALGLELGSISFLVMSRVSAIFGWTEKGWDTAAKRALVVELLAAAALVGVALDRNRSRRSGLGSRDARPYDPEHVPPHP